MHIVTYNVLYDGVTNALKHPNGLAVLGVFFEVTCVFQFCMFLFIYSFFWVVVVVVVYLYFSICHFRIRILCL